MTQSGFDANAISNLTEKLNTSERIRDQLIADTEELNRQIVAKDARIRDLTARKCNLCGDRAAEICLYCGSPEEMAELRRRAKQLYERMDTGAGESRVNDMRLELRLTGSEILRPSTAEDIQDESHSSFETVLAVSNIMRVLGVLPDDKAIDLHREVYALIRKYDQ